MSADDISHANGVGVFDGNISKLFVASLKYDISTYFNWQGTYTSMFLQAFLSPLNGFGLVQLRAVMIINAILFIISLVIFVYAICKCCSIGINKAGVILCVCVMGIFGFTSWTEIFYWFSGAVSYSFPLSFCLLGVSLTLRGRKVYSHVFAAILMFLASGGSLVVAGTGCFMLLTICAVKKMLDKAERKDYIIFGVATIGALINTIAPGNYVRYSNETGLHFGIAIMGSVREVINTVEELLYNTPFILFIAIALIVGIKIGRDRGTINGKSIYTIIFFSAVTPFITCFPVCLAIIGTGLANRCQFVEMVVVIISLVTVAVAVGCLLSKTMELQHKQDIYLLLAMFLIVMPNINPSWKLSELVPYQMWKYIAGGDYKNYYDQINKMYSMIGKDTNEDVFIEEIPEKVPHFLELYISEDVSNVVNKGIAKYYKKKTVQYVPSYEGVPSYVYECTDGTKNIRISPKWFECDMEFVSIFNIRYGSEVPEAIQILQPLNSNIVLSTQEGESGKIGIYIFSDSEGRNCIKNLEIEY